MRNRKLRFLTPAERRVRIEAAMRTKVSDDYPDGWTWYKLAKEMRTDPSSVDRAFKVKPGDKYEKDVTLGTLKRLARALGVTVGYLVDMKET